MVKKSSKYEKYRYHKNGNVNRGKNSPLGHTYSNHKRSDSSDEVHGP